MKLVALAAAATVAASPAAGGVSFLQARQLNSGGFAEAGNPAYPQLTAWAVLGVRAAGATPSRPAARYLVQHEPELRNATDLALVVLAAHASSIPATVSRSMLWKCSTAASLRLRTPRW